MKFFDRRPTAKAYGTMLGIMAMFALVICWMVWPVIASTNMGILNASVHPLSNGTWSCPNEDCPATAALTDDESFKMFHRINQSSADRITAVGLVTNCILLAPVVILFLASLDRQAAPEPDFD